MLSTPSLLSFHVRMANLRHPQLKAGSLDPMSNWQMLPVLLSPWKLAATSIELRFTLQQLDEALQHESTRERANHFLDRLTLAVFGQGMSSEEADFVAEMMQCVCPQVTTKVCSQLFNSTSGSSIYMLITTRLAFTVCQCWSIDHR